MGRVFYELAVRCTECDREVDEFTTIAERWLYYYDESELLPYCPACAEREFEEISLDATPPEDALVRGPLAPGGATC
jgi:hypothetical protein